MSVHPALWRTQRVPSHALWDEEARRATCAAVTRCRDDAVERPGAAGAVPVVDETGFLKKGKHPAGVTRQDSGTAGRVEDSQVGVFLAYGSRTGHAPIDRRLYLPQAWAGDLGRRRTARIPDEAVPFRTKPELARAMLARALAAGVPCAWVLGDGVYGADRQPRTMPEARGRPYGPTSRRSAATRAGVGACGPDRPARAGGAGPSPAAPGVAAAERRRGGRGRARPFDWARLRLVRLQAPPWGHRLLVRRSIADPEDPAYFVVFGPAPARLIDLARVAGRRWSVAECLEAAEQEVGPADDEVRSWHGWHRHVTLAMLALARLAALRAGLNAAKGGAADRRPAPRPPSASPRSVA